MTCFSVKWLSREISTFLIGEIADALTEYVIGPHKSVS
jgi:hypothetical protein